MAQVELQPSPFVVLPSSHCSRPVMRPSPQVTVMTGTKSGPERVTPGSSWQVGPQPSPAIVLPSSQPSPGSAAAMAAARVTGPGGCDALPHTVCVQGPSPLAPQVYPGCRRQFTQAAGLFTSHCSLPLTTPSPHTGWQLTPGGHTQPVSTVQVAEHPSPPTGVPGFISVPGPSSQASSGARKPSPQIDCTQSEGWPEQK